MLSHTKAETIITPDEKTFFILYVETCVDKNHKLSRLLETSKSCFARETILFALTIFSGVDLHLFHNRSLPQYQNSELFFLPSQSSQFHKYVFYTHLSYVHSRIKRTYTTRTYTPVRSRVITPLTYCRLRGCWYEG